MLSPLLFVIFISDMLLFNSDPTASALLKENSCSYKYADDGTIAFIHKSLICCYNMAQEACTLINTWCKKWRLKVNCSVNKTEAIIVKAKEEAPIIPNLKIGDREILYVKQSKVLGILIDENLKFSTHASAQLRNCWYTWYSMYC